MDQVLVISKKPIKLIKLSPQYMLYPCSLRTIADPSDLHPSLRQINHNEYMEMSQRLGSPHLNSKEVHRRDRFPMQLEKLSPSGSFAPIWGGSRPFSRWMSATPVHAIR